MFTIRSARPSEYTMIREQRAKAYDEHVPKIPEEHWQLLKQSILSDADLQAGVLLLVAETEGGIAGSVALFPADSDAYKGLADAIPYPEIRMLAVDPVHRGKGIAKALLMECFRLAKEAGNKQVGLHTADFMDSAIRLYESLGFERVPSLDFEPANDGIVVKAFRKSLDYSSRSYC